MRYWDIDRVYNSRVQVRCPVCTSRVNGSVTRHPEYPARLFDVRGTCTCGVEIRGTFSGLLIRDGRDKATVAAVAE